MSLGDERIAETILDLLARRGPDGTICPSEAARALAREETAWRALMPQVRRVAAVLCAAGTLRVTAHGQEVDPLQARGPIRLARRAADRPSRG